MAYPEGNASIKLLSSDHPGGFCINFWLLLECSAASSHGKANKGGRSDTNRLERLQFAAFGIPATILLSFMNHS
eukprot:scaffold286569_cov14-Tisochrysis_lutea.AAC.2